MRKLIALLGLAVLGVGGYYVVQKYAKAIPELLARDATDALQRANILGLTVEMDGLDATLVGAVHSAAQRDAAVAAVNRVSGIRRVDARVVIQPPDRGPGDPGPQPRDPAIALEARWQDGVLTLSGHVVGAALDERIDQKIRQVFAGAPTAGTLQRRPGDPPDLDDAVKRVVAGLEALAQTSHGVLRVSDTAVTLNGTVGDDATRDRMAALLRNHVKAPVELALVVSVAPPVILEDDGDDDVEEAAAPDAEEAAAPDAEEAAAPDAEEAAAPDAEEAAAPDIEEATAPDIEEAIAPDTEATGEPDAEEAPAPAPSDAGGPPHGVDLAATSALTAEECEDVLLWLVEGEKRIQFDGKRQILPESEPTVARAAAVLQRCPDANVVIEGFTDAYGEPDEQRNLSWRWAFNVRKRLAELGVDEKRMTARGFGVNRARYPNNREQRHLNRRVEFKLTGVK